MGNALLIYSCLIGSAMGWAITCYLLSRLVDQPEGDGEGTTRYTVGGSISPKRRQSLHPNQIMGR